jgi:hypothetical protein
MKNTLIHIALVIWQLPQILLALLVIIITKATRTNNEAYKGRRIYRFKKSFISGVSLGEYIIVRENANDTTIRHEYGHTIQSLYFGPLYLIVIGIPSAVFNNLYDRLFHKKWSYASRTWWYYNRFPEDWADILGGVFR